MTRGGFFSRLLGGAAAVVAAPITRAIAPTVAAESYAMGSGSIAGPVVAAGTRGWAYVYADGAMSLIRSGSYVGNALPKGCVSIRAFVMSDGVWQRIGRYWSVGR